eukprot:maker-scaffold154_size301342-snap-gene-0.14 protein:Tk07763 transcript:maker-scaffold154_size301342-snap-gene-0.14-mRNA-1 annotation:"hypothetical protein LOTGIDRAFT_203908"
MKRAVSQMGWLRHVLTALAVFLFILGCFIIGYMAWVLASSVTVSRFLEGTLIFTYVVIGLGFTLFFSGLIGWVGGTSESTCLVRLFLIAVVVTILAEIGGIIALSVVRIQFGDIVQSGWEELNQGTRNIVQFKLSCCGWEGPKDFAYNNEPIHESCYERVQKANSGIWNRRSDEEDFAPVKKMKQDGCGEKLHGWFQDNKIMWVTLLASIVALQIMCCGIAMYILSRVKKLNRLRENFRLM